MIYLIGGIPRSGKTTLASLILDRKRISCLSTDILRNVLDYSPARVGILERPENERPDAFYPYLYKLLRILQNKYDNYVIEGDIFTPAHVTELQKNIELRTCFLGMGHIDLGDLTEEERRNWAFKLHEDELTVLPEKLAASSRLLEERCDHCDIRYFDTSNDRPTALESAYSHLTSPL